MEYQERIPESSRQKKLTRANRDTLDKHADALRAAFVEQITEMGEIASNRHH